MTRGQVRALRELRRIRDNSDGGFDFENPTVVGGWLVVEINLRVGPVLYLEGGLQLREREHFVLEVPPDFPFRKPVMHVKDVRYAGRPHVTWGKWICLYQSEAEWNPSDGLYGWFTRLSNWLGLAAANDMDPIEGPLEPPHHSTDFEKTPFMFVADSPAKAGDFWIGVAELKKSANRIEVVGWHPPSASLAPGTQAALAIILRKPLPMEYPTSGADFFKVLNEQGVNRDTIIPLLRLASLYGEIEDPAYVILGAPSRRGPDLMPKQHFAVWAAKHKRYLKTSTPSTEDSAEVAKLREELAATIIDSHEEGTLSWCPIYDDRAEIVVRRDKTRPMSYFTNKRVLLLGAGALGSWAGELIARSAPAALDIVDKAAVKPGLLIRQNFTLADIGASKATALASRLAALGKVVVKGHEVEACDFLMADLARTQSYDVIIDCTASLTFQMKLEEKWRRLGGKTPRYAAFVIDARAEKILGVTLQANSLHGPYVGYLQLKHALCQKGVVPLDFRQAFYSEAAFKDLFQPEPGCSDPTFAGSGADAATAAGTFLNIVGESKAASCGYALSAHTGKGEKPIHVEVELDKLSTIECGPYRVFISPAVLASARTHVHANNKKNWWKKHETGGLLWGHWDDAAGTIVVFNASGPPADSKHDPGHFECGTKGTREMHEALLRDTYGASSFIGMWHTHPDMPASQSSEDLMSMSALVSGIAHNQRRGLMVIFGRLRGKAEAGIYVYESLAEEIGEVVQHAQAIIPLSEAVI